MKTRSLPPSGVSGRLACCRAIQPGFGESGPDAPCATSAIARLQSLPTRNISTSNWSGPAHSIAEPERDRLPVRFDLAFAARRVVGALHGVDGHFDLISGNTQG